MTARPHASAALFEAGSDATMTPSPWCRGPWDPDHCHGGPIAALVARELEHVTGDEPWQAGRLTVELLRPATVGQPITVSSSIERPGRKVSLVGVSLTSGGVEIARARCLRVRVAPLELSPAPDVEPSMSPPESGRRERPQLGDPTLVAFANDAMEHRVVRGSWAEPGPIELWMRLTVPLVAGEPLTGLQRAAASADFGNGVSAALPWDTHTFINPELTLHLSRPPHGEWIGLRAASTYGPLGAGFAETALFDRTGRFGRGAQSVLVDSR